MPLDRLNDVLARHVATLEEAGTAKGAETVVVEVIPPAGERGPRFRLEGAGDREFIRMNSNSYLGLSLVPRYASLPPVRSVGEFRPAPPLRPLSRPGA